LVLGVLSCLPLPNILGTRELALHYNAYEDTAMAKDKEPFEALTATEEQTAEQIMKQTQGAMENYFGWLQKTMSHFHGVTRI